MALQQTFFQMPLSSKVLDTVSPFRLMVAFEFRIPWQAAMQILRIEKDPHMEIWSPYCFIGWNEILLWLLYFRIIFSYRCLNIIEILQGLKQTVEFRM